MYPLKERGNHPASGQLVEHSPADAPTALAWGTVTEAHPATVSVSVVGSEAECHYLASYTPEVGDVVLVAEWANGRCVIGKRAC